MLVEDVKMIEKEFFSDRKEMAVPKLMCAYFEQGRYEMAYYLADKYRDVFGEAEFYLMMSFMELGHYAEADALYLRRKEEWFHLCKQWKIYWKHAALFSLLFKDFNFTEFYENLFDEYYDDTYIRLIELLKTEDKRDVLSSACFLKAVEKNPILGKIWKREEKAAPKVISFENVEWNVWGKYNSKITNGQKFGMETVYCQDGLRIYSYKPKEVSASMHILTDGITSIVLDCGCEMNGVEVIRIPVKEIFEHYGLHKIDAVFISHAHMDHYGSLNEIRKENIFMTSVTKQLIRFFSPETALLSVNVLEAYAGVDIDGVVVTFLPNGHIRGSVAMDIDWKGAERLVYTGDFSIEDQQTVAGFRMDDIFERNEKKVDILITETTYGNRKGMLTLRQYENMFVELCRKQLEYGNKVIIPCFAAGRAQEAALLLAPMVREMGKKILIDGLAAKITEFYQLSMTKNILNKNISICSSEFDYAERLFNNDIILASSGMMRPGSTSARYMEEMLEKENISMIKIGFIQKEEHMLASVINRQHKNINYVDIPLSAHVSYSGLIRTLEAISPDCAIYVHGSGIDRS